MLAALVAVLVVVAALPQSAVAWLPDQRAVLHTLTLAEQAVQPELITPYEVVGSYPHDRAAFLQGLVWYDGGFYESTGLYGQSSLRRVAFPSGDVQKKVDVPREHFGEGLALVGDRLLQLTWRSKRGFIYDRESFSLLGDFPYETEGWGLTFDGTSLILSDGSATLTFLDPNTYQPTRTLDVTMSGRRVRLLNELEYIDGEVWANVWQTDVIVRINPESGQVVGVLDMTTLYPADQHPDRDDVLNGIAYDPDTGRIFVGGKRWPLIFEIRRT